MGVSVLWLLESVVGHFRCSRAVHDHRHWCMPSWPIQIFSSMSDAIARMPRWVTTLQQNESLSTATTSPSSSSSLSNQCEFSLIERFTCFIALWRAILNEFCIHGNYDDDYGKNRPMQTHSTCKIALIENLLDDWNGVCVAFECRRHCFDVASAGGEASSKKSWLNRYLIYCCRKNWLWSNWCVISLRPWIQAWNLLGKCERLFGGAKGSDHSRDFDSTGMLRCWRIVICPAN